MTAKKKILLSNPVNKQAFVDLIADHFRLAGSRTVKFKDDADVTIAITSMDLVKAVNKVLFWGDDTDLFVIVLHHLSDMNRKGRPKIWFYRLSYDSTISSQTWTKIWSLEYWPWTFLYMSFLAAIQSPHSTNWEKNFIQRLQQRPTEIRVWLLTFIDPVVSQDALFKAGKELIISMHNITNKQCFTLKELRIRWVVVQDELKFLNIYLTLLFT